LAFLLAPNKRLKCHRTPKSQDCTRAQANNDNVLAGRANKETWQQWEKQVLGEELTMALQH